MKTIKLSFNSIKNRLIYFLFFNVLTLLNVSIILTENNKYVYFPLKRKVLSYIKNIKDINDIMKFLYLEPLVSEITIGTPEQKSNFIFRTDCTYIYLTSFNHNISHLDQASNYIQLKYGNFKYFKEENSKSINYYEKIYNFSSREYNNQYFSKCISENVKINNQNIKLDLMLSNSIKYEEPGAICLQLSEDDNSVLEFTASFPVLLKRNYSLIDNYRWFIYYGKNNEKDYLVLGTSVNEFKNPETGKKLYPNFDLEKNYYIVRDSLEIRRSAMTLEFDKIYVISNSNKEEEDFEETIIKAKLFPNIGIIVGTKKYNEYLNKTIFSKYIDLEQCFVNIFSQRPDLTGQEYSYYYCKESLYNDISKKFKTIKFKHITLSENFELTFNDLFLKKNGYLIFLVIFSTHLHDYWDLGTPFLKKYQFDYYFDLKIDKDHKKRIGYYHFESEIQVNNYKKSLFILLSILIIVFSGLLIIIGIYFGKNYFSQRKKRANELDDDFVYVEKKGEKKILDD